MTLHPGDLLATGTPSGVGKASGRFLTEGDRVSITISGIGTLVNPVVADA
jgi:2-keto-4-pentenoate hydratase/2-oxohepta-3-ene-1,7-dioic acid hydratase in catechol pathway